MTYDKVPTWASEDDGHVLAVIETPKLTRHKYAFEPKFGAMLLKQTLAEGLTWPYDYGFVPQTIADDGDALDILVLNDEPALAGGVVAVQLLGAIQLRKNGVENDRLIARPVTQQKVALMTDSYRKLKDLPEELLLALERFLVEYSEVEGNRIELIGRCGRKIAMSLVRKAHAAFQSR